MQTQQRSCFTRRIRAQRHALHSKFFVSAVYASGWQANATEDPLSRAISARNATRFTVDSSYLRFTPQGGMTTRRRYEFMSRICVERRALHGKFLRARTHPIASIIPRPRYAGRSSSVASARSNSTRSSTRGLSVQGAGAAGQARQPGERENALGVTTRSFVLCAWFFGPSLVLGPRSALGPSVRGRRRWAGASLAQFRVAVALTKFLPAGGAGRGIPAPRRKRLVRDPRTWRRARRGETRRQDPDSVNAWNS